MSHKEESGVIWFADNPLPPVRVPKLDQNKNYILAFKSEADRADQQDRCVHQVDANCLKGLRQACSIKASRQARPSPLLAFFGLAKEESWEERERREEELTVACISQGAPHCRTHAQDFCKVAFSDQEPSET